MKLIFIIFCLFALTFGQDETIEIPSSDYCILRFGRSVHYYRRRHHPLQGSCNEGFCCVQERCTSKCPIRRHKHHRVDY
uniref:Uncharacterized protein n=1 Tax=Panagrolaimus davidi TaxID=227884 RepID=A0A914Q2L8_9BILA